MSLSTLEVFKHIQPEGAVVLTDEQLLDLQKTLNGILRDIISVCAKHHLRYFLGGGSALGAIRHHGFIPWDDDIDINMPREDHDRFVQVFRQEFGTKYWVHTPEETAGYGLLLSRVLLKGTSVRTREDFHNPECGAFIDIFVIENTYDNAFLRNIHGFGCMAFGFAQSCRKFFRDRKELMELAKTAEGDADRRKEYIRTFRTKIVLGALLSFASLDTWIRWSDRWYSRCHDGSSRYVTIPAGRGHFYGELYRREDICEGIPVQYDDMKVFVSKGYDLYLKRLYGDYRKIPEEADREKHVFFAPFYLHAQNTDNPAQSAGITDRGRS